MSECEIPPKGWKCSRPKGHTGPCAATPIKPHKCGAHLIASATGQFYCSICAIEELTAERDRLKAELEAALTANGKWLLAESEQIATLQTALRTLVEAADGPDDELYVKRREEAKALLPEAKP